MKKKMLMYLAIAWFTLLGMVVILGIVLLSMAPFVWGPIWWPVTGLLWFSILVLISIGFGSVLVDDCNDEEE